MIYIVFVLCLFNLALLLGIAATLGKMLRAKESRENYMYSDGFKKGRIAMLETMRQNMERHKDIMPAWVIEWVDHLSEGYKKMQAREEALMDLPAKYEGHVDYSNVLELQKAPSDIRMLRDD